VESIFSTKQVHPRDRFDCWHSVACKSLIDHSSRPKSRSGFEAEIETGSLGSIDLVLFQNSPMHVLHTALQVARLKSDHVFICRQIRGAVLIEQDTRSASLQAGDVTLVDPLLPYEATFGTDSKTLVLKARRRDLEARLGKIRSATARLIKPVGLEHTLTSSVSAMLPSLAANMDCLTGEVVGNHALDLVAISLAKTMQATVKVRVSDCRALMLSSIRAAVESKLADPQLDSASVAGAAGVSVRYANDLLAEQDTSLMRLIQARRLARCRYAFEDPNQAHRRVSEIAYGWGFTDMTHFGRRFKKAYGMSPSEYRMLAKKKQPND
jgi:AraC family transcriptional activator of tynA and feaB